jgi:hypothetical protein
MSHHSTAVLPVLEQSKIRMLVLHFCGIDGKPGDAGDGFGQAPGSPVIFVQIGLEIFPKRSARQRQECRLAHAAAQLYDTERASSMNALGANDQRAYGRAKPF